MKVRIKNPIWGVPISFLDKYCTTQFEILGIANNVRWIGDFPCLTIIKGEKVYNRILIRRKKQIHFGTEFYNIFSEVKLKNNSIMKIRIKNPVMGVPISFLDKYCPTQFEIIKFRKGNDDKDLSVNGKCPYFRILIRRKK